MSRSYSGDLREGLYQRVFLSVRVAVLSKECGIYEGTLYRWKVQANIGSGVKAGAKCFQANFVSQSGRTPYLN